MLVSIVTPSLNQGAYIDRTIRSVAEQTHANVEHIVVDGGSMDDTLTILQRHPRLHWVSEPDGGMYEAVNKGLRLAKGEVLAYLNADDRYFPWTIASVVEAFQRHPEADFVFGDALKIDDVTGAAQVVLQPPNAEALVRAGFLVQPTVFWRRRVYEAEGAFDEGLRFVADCDYWIRTAHRRRFLRIDEFLAIELDHPGTQRVRYTQELDSELAAVRARHARPQHWPQRFFSRVQMSVWHRWIWLRFALQAKLGPHGRGRWSAFLREYRVSVALRPLAGQMLPRGYRFIPHTVRVEPRGESLDESTSSRGGGRGPHV